MAFIVRNYTDSDFKHLADFCCASVGEEPAGGEKYAEFLVQKFRRPAYDPNKYLFLAEEKKVIIGYGDLIHESLIKRAIIDVFVLPQFRRQGIGRMLLDRLLSRSHDMKAEHIHVSVSDFNSDAHCFLDNSGFSFIRYFHNLQLDTSGLRSVDMNTGDFELGCFQTGEEAVLAVLQNKIFSGSWGFCPNTLEEIEFYLRLTHCRITDIVCLGTGGKKVGYVWFHPLPRKSTAARLRIHMFGVEPEFQRRGLGKILLQTTLVGMKNRGAETVQLTVDAGNTAAVSLYESHGFSLRSRSRWYEKKL